MAGVEPKPGTYALILRATARESVPIGRLGKLELRPGFYLYVGSALGPGGVRARIRHHLKRATRPHWHIDYLRPATRLVEVWYSHAEAVQEHAWAEGIRRMRCVSTPLAGFGSSDCRCPSHLFFHPERPSRRALCRALHPALPRSAVLQYVGGAECVGRSGAG